MDTLRKTPPRFAQLLFRNDSGQDLIEYALVAALIGLGAAASMRYVQTSILNAVYNSIGIVMSSF